MATDANTDLSANFVCTHPEEVFVKIFTVASDQRDSAGTGATFSHEMTIWLTAIGYVIGTDILRIQRWGSSQVLVLVAHST